MLSLVLGDRDARLQRVVDRIFGGKVSGDVEVLRFDASEAPLEDIVNAASMGSFFGDGQKVLVQNAPLPGRKTNPLWNWLKGTAGDLPESLLMVVTFHTDDLNVSERRRHEKHATTLADKVDAVELHVVPPVNTRSPRAARAWVLDLVRENGMSIDAATVDYLVERSSSDGSALEQEVLKVAALLGFSGAITRADVDRADPYPADESVFDLLGAIATKQAGRALEVLGTTMEQGGEPEMILAILGTQVRRMLAVSEMPRSEAANRELRSALRQADWQLRRLREEAARFIVEDLRTMLHKLVDLDLRQKTGGLRHGGLARALEALTVRFCYRTYEGAGSGGRR